MLEGRWRYRKKKEVSKSKKGKIPSVQMKIGQVWEEVEEIIFP